ncbi:hypothetical protein EHQ52_17010 [Leptospira koniambonensis]|uniref:B box-type domain-containing protein n=1 Tax=Leptospira koniambonensis TaxID=2484950 RepID=A0A4R9J3Y6_9LEPT|nr:hypothetical protein [Leptospira koniambonensis]TGL31626.1 hypothetical protein EHQ52_17010 [Leptospira koniambonensis]
MKCYSHNEQDAIAICKHCNKALCSICAVDTGLGISCHGLCEQEVKFYGELLNKSKKTYATTAGTFKRSSLIYLLLGIVFLGFGFLNLSNGVAILMIPAGVVFILGSYLNYSSGNKFLKKD